MRNKRILRLLLMVFGLLSLGAFAPAYGQIGKYVSVPAGLDGGT